MLSRFCPHGNLRRTCSECRVDAVAAAEARAAENRARGDVGRQSLLDEPVLHYPWQREAFEAWVEAGRSGLVSFSPGLPVGDLYYSAMADVLKAAGDTNVLIACSPSEQPGLLEVLEGRFGLRPTTLLDHHFLEPREDGVLLVADLQELSTVDLASWGRFASNALLVLTDADAVGSALGQFLVNSAFRFRLCLSRMPSAFDLVAATPWARAFGPLVYRYTEEEARDVGILPRIRYRLNVEVLRPEPGGASGPVGPWDASDVPAWMPAVSAGQFARGRARDLAIARAEQTEGLVVVHGGVRVPGALATLRLDDLREGDDHGGRPSAWLLAEPAADSRAVLRLATVAFKTLGGPGAVEDTVVLPVPADLCRVPPWDERWRQAAVQLDRVVTGLLLAEDVTAAMLAEDLEALVGVALALRGLAAEDLYHLSPVVETAAAAAYGAEKVSPEQVREAARTYGGLAAAILVAAELGPLALLRLAHPRFTPTVPDLPHPSLLDARSHAWRGRAFQALAHAASRGDVATAWGRYPELRFVFPSSQLLEAATEYCRVHKLKGPLDGAELKPIPDRTRVADGDVEGATRVLKEWSDALALAEEDERNFLAGLHARQPERERRREGMALPDLRLADASPDTVRLESKQGRFPNTNIAPGSEVALVAVGGREELGRGLVSRIDHRRLAIEFPAGAPRNLPKRLTVNLIFDAKVFEAYHSATLGALRAIKSTNPVDDGPDGLLRAALLGETEAPAAQAQSLKVEGLTPSQSAAINAVLSGGRVRLIHGPPGTGKTHTLVHLAMALSRAGHSVLVTADSNAAVDNLVVGLRRSGALAVRVGHAPNIRDPAAQGARVDPLEAPRFVRWASESGVVVATTNYGAFRYIDPKGGLSPFIFDYVIHDEAGQATAPSSLAAVLRGRRLVLAGDPLQLPPTVVSMDAKAAGLDVTLFERVEQLTGRGRTRLLATQFRMREPIVAFSNKRYYEDRIETAPVAAAQEGLAEFPPASFLHVSGRENDRAKNGSISNDFEVEAVVAAVSKLQGELRDRGWTLAVLTPYQAQREALRRRIPEVEVSTVDGAQGREWDVVLYTSVRSNPRHRLGFVSDERRLNVAVTRARRNFILVGDERTLSDHGGFRDLMAACSRIEMEIPEPQRQPPRTRRPPRKGKGPQRQQGQRGGQQAPQGQQGQQGQQGPGGAKRRRRRRKPKGAQSESGDAAGKDPSGPGRQPPQQGGGQGGDGEGPPSGKRRRRRRRGRRRSGPDGEQQGPGDGSSGGPPEQGRAAKPDGSPAAGGDKTRAPRKPRAPRAPRAPKPPKEAGAAPAPKATPAAPAASKARAKPVAAKAAAAKAPAGAKPQCSATTAKGARCRKPAKAGGSRCATHA